MQVLQEHWLNGTVAHRIIVEIGNDIQHLPSVTPQEPVIRDNRVKDELNGVENELDSTTKNDLEVDCISRADAIKAMQDKAKKLKNEDTINGLCGAVAILYEMPPIMPIRPKGHWITETAKHNRHLGSRNGYCSVCKDFYTDDWDIMNYCPNCGVKMDGAEI